MICDKNPALKKKKKDIDKVYDYCFQLIVPKVESQLKEKNQVLLLMKYHFPVSFRFKALL